MPTSCKAASRPVPSPPMAASLHELLAQESTHQRHKPRRFPRHATPPLCADRRSIDLPFRPRTCSSLPAKPPTSRPCTSRANSLVSNYALKPSQLAAAASTDRRIDVSSSNDVAVRSVVSVLAGYAGRFTKDAAFRRRLRDASAGCLAATRKVVGAAHAAALVDLELGFESVEQLAEEGTGGGPPRDSNIQSLRNAIRLLSSATSVPNAHLSACAQLYLAVLHKIDGNDRVSARHVLQVFMQAPYLARKSLLPDLWDHFLFPHLLHIEVWYKREAELVAGFDAQGREQRMKDLNRAYTDQMDAGTAQFAVYYVEWIRVGGKEPPLPTVALPLRPIHHVTGEKRSSSPSQRLISRNLYQAVFGLSMESEGKKTALELELNDEQEICKHRNLHTDVGIAQRETEAAREDLASRTDEVPHKSHSFLLFSCRSMPDAASVRQIHVPKKEPSVVDMQQVPHTHPSNLSWAIGLISESDKLEECETAIGTIAKIWHDTHGGSSVVAALSTPSFIEGLLEVILTSKHDDALELSISILAELVTRNDLNRQVVLNADPQLESFLRLLRSNSLFLKAAVITSLLKPKAKQMLSLDWIPSILRVLEHGEENENLFTVKCCPRSAAFYILDQLLSGFDVDRNAENSKQLISLGGLDLLIRRFELGNDDESRKCASLLVKCIQAEGSCREYLARNIKKTPIVQLLLDNKQKSFENAIFLLSELVCLKRTTKIIAFLNELKNDGYLNTMHVLLVFLQQAPVEQRPVAAALLLQLDLLGDPLKFSVYREEAIDAFIAALERNLHSKKIQEKCSRAFVLLGSRFSSLGEATSEAWLLQRAGLYDSFSESFRREEILVDEYMRLEEEEKVTEEWLGKLTYILLSRGNRRFLVALSNGIAEGVSGLKRSCLVTVAWMSSSLASWHNVNHLQSLACSTLAPRLFESLSYNRPQEERILASFSLFNYLRYPECLPQLFPLDKEAICSLQDLAQVTWTAKELLFACCR